MTRLVQFEANAGYYWLLEAAIKSFMRFNPGWSVYVSDIGLTPEQRDELAAFAIVRPYKADDNTRWPSSMARVQTMLDIGKDYDLFLHLDADTLTFGSIDSLATAFAAAPVDMAATPGIPNWRHVIVRDVVRPLIPNFNAWLDQPGHNAGFLLSRGNITSRLASDILELRTRLSGVLTNHDEAPIAILVGAGKYSMMTIDRAYNCTDVLCAETNPALFNPPLMAGGSPIVIAHIPAHKNAIFQLDGSRSSASLWWRQMLARYRDEPWPK